MHPLSIPYFGTTFVSQHQPAHSHHSQSCRHHRLPVAQEKRRQMPENIQLLPRQAPSLRELGRGTEHNSPTARALNPLAESSQAGVKRTGSQRTSRRLFGAGGAGGRTTSSFLPPRDLPSLNVPFCPSPASAAGLTTLLCPARGRSPCHTPPPGPSGQQKEKQHGHCRPQRCLPRLIFPKRKSDTHRLLFPRRDIPS